MNIRRMLEGLWADHLWDLAEAEARAKGRALLESFLSAKRAEVLKKVKKRGAASVREALYHLWAVRLGGELGDKIRDAQEAAITKALAGQISDNTPKAEVVRLVTRAIVEHVF